MGKKKKHEDELPVELPEVVEDSDDGSTETESDEFLGDNDPTENDDSDFGC
jgi:hypothetical protein